VWLLCHIRPPYYIGTRDAIRVGKGSGKFN
jgi:hypothetical protein